MTLRREADGNVVLSSGDCDIRFFRNFGGAPLEFWRRGFPGPITNRFPGSGVSVSWELGQDPTQATSNGIAAHPICCFGMPSTDKYNYYIREYVYDAAGSYGVSGFCPDFLLFHESIDCYPCPPAHGWTAINNALIFSGSPAHSSGIFSPGNEMEPGRIRRYPRGKISFKIKTILKSDSGIAGFMFRKSVVSQSPQMGEFYFADGYHLNLNRAGQWQLIQQRGAVQTSIANGILSSTERTRLITGGLVVEVRTNNALPGAIEIYFDDVLRKSLALDNPILGDAFGYFAQCSNGTIGFVDSQVFDMGVQFSSRYTSHLDGTFRQVVVVEADEPRDFYRANTPGAFLNSELFAQRECQALPHAAQQWVPAEGLHQFGDYRAFWCGNEAGTLGLCARDLVARVDGAPSADAHLLLQRYAVNNEFILHLNPLPALRQTRCRRIDCEVTWSTTRWTQCH